MARFYLSPSRIARYYFLECDRYLRFMAVPRERRDEEAIPPMDPDYSPVARAVLEGGYDWEQVVLDKHLTGRVVLPPDDGTPAPLHERKLSYQQTVKALGDLEPGDSLYQPTLSVPDAFYKRHGLDPDLVTLRDCYPDLVTVVEGDYGPEARVIDVKASNWMKLSHRIQVGVYTMILGAVLEAEGIDLRMGRSGGVWLYGQPEPEWFNLAHIIPPIETFLEDDLPSVLEAEKEDAFWHLNFRCEWCEYFTHCRTEAEDTSNVSLVPYLSHFAKRHLASTAGVKSVADLRTMLERPDAEDLAAGSASLEGKLPQLRRSVESLLTEQAIPTGAASVSMPVGEHVRVVLTLQSEPLTGEMYGYAISRAFGKDLFGNGRDTVTAVVPDNRPETLAGLRRRLVGDLMAILRPVHDHNTAHADDWWSQRSVQVYVYDTYERGLLTTVLLEATGDPAVAEDALSLVFYFQRPEVVEADDHPDTEVFFPVVALTEVIRQVMALPVPIAYQLSPVSRAIAPSQYPWDYRESDFFSFRLSNRMKSNAIFEVWHRDRADYLESIERELSHRVWAANSVVNGLKERLKNTGALFAWPPRFFLPPGAGFSNPLLSRLAFIARFESVTQFTALRTERGAPLTERLAKETTLRLTSLGDGRYRLDPDQLEADIEPSTFYNWILTGDHEAGRRARLSFNDFAYRDRQYPPKNLDLALAALVDRPTEDTIELALKQSKSFTEPRRGDTVYLEPRFTDWTTEKLIAELSQLDVEDSPWFVDLLTDSVAARTPIADPSVTAAASELARRHGMTPSQLAAFTGTLGHSLQVVWGPPGTGKTHFLAAAVLCLVEAHRRAARPFRVLITAMTNTAIDNCLLKVYEIQAIENIVAGDFTLGKLNGDLSEIESINAQAAHRGLGERAIVGGTVWQARKTSPADLSYDMVVIDEGSQLRVGDSAIAVRRLAPGGRLLIAGDDRQLPPIVQAEFPTPSDGLPLHRSVLEAIRAGDPPDELTVALVENFRMNNRLCDYPRQSIYPEEYAPANEAVAKRRLTLSTGSNEFTDLVLDPEYPLTLCVLEDVRATARNPLEAQMAAEIVTELRRRLPVDSDRQFADESVFVVSPHHAQIRQVKRALTAIRRWSPMPVVGTVDKMQGQERDAVVVSYGVSDVETAVNERQFIYSLNRLNVAITRARAKTIVFIPRPLLEPPIQVLDIDEVAEGAAFMQGLMHWCENANGQVQLATIGGPMTVYRG